MAQHRVNKLAKLLVKRRAQLSLSLSEVARRANLDKGTLSLIERGKITSPHIDTLKAIARALEIPAADILAANDWMGKDDLPALMPYLRVKYGELPDPALAELREFFGGVVRRYGTDGPAPGEDEYTEPRGK